MMCLFWWSHMTRWPSLLYTYSISCEQGCSTFMQALGMGVLHRLKASMTILACVRYDLVKQRPARRRWASR